MATNATNAPRSMTISRDRLYDLVWMKPTARLAREFGVSPNTLSKICDRMLVPRPGRDHWTKAKSARNARPPLPPAPPGTCRSIVFNGAGEAAQSRRTRSRMSPADRVDQIMAVARDMIIRDGLAAVSLKRVARAAGISETLIYHYYPGRLSLFMALARRELDAVRDGQRLGLESRDDDLEAGIRAATTNYLVVMAERGDLLQTLLSDPLVAAQFQQEYKLDRETIVRTLANAAVKGDGVPRPVAMAASHIITAVTMRAGRLLVKKKLPVDRAIAISLAAARTGAAAVVKAYGTSAGTRLGDKA